MDYQKEICVGGRSIGAHTLLFWCVVIVIVSFNIQFDLTQDIGAYYRNIYDYSVSNEFTNDVVKQFWYRFFLYPLYSLTYDIDLTLAIVKSIIMLLFFISQKKFIWSNLDASLLIFVVVVTPALAENMEEYLRQGMAIGIFLLALSTPQSAVRLALVGISTFLHYMTAFLLISTIGGVYLGKFIANRENQNAFVVSPALVVMVAIGAGVFGFLGSKFIFVLLFTDIPNFLGGDRSNVFAFLYLASYTSYVGIQAAYYRSIPHASVFVGLIIVSASYSAILDFGRAISLIAPLHLHAALTLYLFKDRVRDLLVMAVAGSVFLLA